jgi:hypothetical protein
MIHIEALTLHLPTLLAARNERSIVHDDYVDLTEVVEVIREYVALPLVDDSYVRSSTILRIAQHDHFWGEKNMGRFVTRLAFFIVTTFLECETWKFGDVNTPDERLKEIFAENFLEFFQGELRCVPIIRGIDELGVEVLVPDLFVCTFLARAFGTIAATSRELEAREEKRLFFPNEVSIKVSLIDVSEMIGDEYEVSEFDEWAAENEFPWDETQEE